MWTKLNFFLIPKIICAKFGWNLPGGSSEDFQMMLFYYYSTTCLIQHLYYPYPCVFLHWFLCLSDHFLCVLHSVILHPVDEFWHKISFPVHVRFDRWHCNFLLGKVYTRCQTNGWQTTRKAHVSFKLRWAKYRTIIGFNTDIEVCPWWLVLNFYYQTYSKQ